MINRDLVKLNLLVFSVFLISGSCAFGQTHIYSESFGSTSNDVGYGVTTDATGNAFLTGSFRGNINLGGGGLTSGGEDDIFLVKFDVVGTHIWSTQFGGPGMQIAKAIANDPSGNIFITGSFVDSIDFGGGNKLTTAFGGTDVFVAKLTSLGNFVWAKSIGNINNDTGTGIKIGPSGNVYVTGALEGNITFASTPYTGFGLTDGFLAKYDSNGNEVWFQGMGSGWHDAANSLDIDAAENIYITGDYQHTGDFGGTLLTSNGQRDIFVSRFDSLGAFQWTQSYGGNSTDAGYSIALDENANIYLTGVMKFTVDFGGGGITAGGNDDIFLVKIDTTGSHIWSNAYGGSGRDWGNSLALDDNGNVYLTGKFANTVDFGGGGITSGGSDDIFSVGFSSTGIHLFSGGFGGGSSEEGMGISININDDIIITGTMNSATNFGGGMLTNSGGTDLYLYIANLSSVLPVSFIDFRTRTSENHVDLQWVVNNNDPYSGFIVERSLGNQPFQEIGKVTPSGLESTGDVSQFTYKDKNLIPGIYHYRIKVQDTNGAFTYSSSILARIKMVGSGVLDINYDFQNKTLILHILQESQVEGLVSLVNFQGQTLRSYSIKGGDQLVMDFSSLPHNCYFIRYVDPYFQSIIKVRKP